MPVVYCSDDVSNVFRVDIRIFGRCLQQKSVGLTTSVSQQLGCRSGSHMWNKTWTQGTISLQFCLSFVSVLYPFYFTRHNSAVNFVDRRLSQIKHAGWACIGRWQAMIHHRTRWGTLTTLSGIRVLITDIQPSNYISIYYRHRDNPVGIPEHALVLRNDAATGLSTEKLFLPCVFSRHTRVVSCCRPAISAFTHSWTDIYAVLPRGPH